MEQAKTYMMTVKEVAAELQISRNRAYELVHTRQIQSVRLSDRRIRVPRPAFEAYVKRLADQGVDPQDDHGLQMVR